MPGQQPHLFKFMRVISHFQPLAESFKDNIRSRFPLIPGIESHPLVGNSFFDIQFYKIPKTQLENSFIPKKISTCGCTKKIRKGINYFQD